LRSLIAVVGLVALAVGWWSSAYPRGMLMAWADHARGHYEIKTYGLPASWDGEFSRLARERYGVKVNHVAGCVVSENLVWYADGYNWVSESRLRARFGKDIFAECAADARAAAQRDHGPR
jgi:hypothetical protein